MGVVNDGTIINEENNNEEREKEFDKFEHQWLDALGMEDDEEFEVLDSDEEGDGECDGESDGEGDREGDVLEDELEDSEDATNISGVIRDYVENPTEIFSVSELDDLKRKERELIERRENGYYRNKEIHKNAYKQIYEAYLPFITRENLLMLHHPWSTQRNESMNKSVSAYAPKDRTFSTTKSLLTRVSVAGAVQGSGNSKVWNSIYNKVGVPIDPVLSKQLENTDKYKGSKNKRQGSKKGKARRSANRHEQLRLTQEQDLRARKDGIAYEAGIAMNQAIKIAKQALANEKKMQQQLPKQKWKCKFHHPRYCRTLGHAACSSPQCFMHSKSPSEREAAFRFILEEKAKKAQTDAAAKGEYYNLGIRNQIVIQYFISYLSDVNSFHFSYI